MTPSELCTYMGNELTSWRERLHDVTSKMDSLPSIDKFKLTTHIEGLHILLTELEDRINELNSDCPTDWGSEKEGIGYKPLDPEYTFKETEGVRHDYDFGG